MELWREKPQEVLISICLREAWAEQWLWRHFSPHRTVGMQWTKLRKLLLWVFCARCKFLSKQTVGSVAILVLRRSPHCSLTFWRVTLTGSSLHVRKAISEFPVAKLKLFECTFQRHWNHSIWMPILGVIPKSLGGGQCCIAAFPCFQVIPMQSHSLVHLAPEEQTYGSQGLVPWGWCLFEVSWLAKGVVYKGVFLSLSSDC